MAEPRDFEISGFFSKNCRRCLRKGTVWLATEYSTKNLTCLRESPIIVTYVRARVTVGNGADETCQVCARDRSIVTHIPADIIPQGDDMAGDGAGNPLKT